MIDLSEFLNLKKFRSNTLHYSVRCLYDRYKQGTLEINPPYQRPYVWTQEQETDLIKSIVQGLPIGNIFLACFVTKRQWTDVYELVDGKQRLTTIFNFLDNCKNQDLSSIVKKYCLTVLSLQDYDDDEIRDIYNRLNFNGTPHKESERA